MKTTVVAAVTAAALAGGVLGALVTHTVHTFRRSQLANPSGLALILQAAEFAAIKHRKQIRKDSQKTPYINHPLGVARILINEGGVEDPDVLAAGLLHDTIEDTETTREELAKVFGNKIANIVMEVTDDKSLPWKERKRLQVVTAESKSLEAKKIKLADKIYNLRDLLKSAPLGWSKERVLLYFDWAEKVFAGLRGTNSKMEKAYREVLDRRTQI